MIVLFVSDYYNIFFLQCVISENAYLRYHLSPKTPFIENAYRFFSFVSRITKPCCNESNIFLSMNTKVKLYESIYFWFYDYEIIIIIVEYIE